MNTLSQEQIKLFKEFISSHDFFYVAGHKEPDGDCISSCLGIKAILEHFKKPFQLLSAGPFKRIEIQKYKDLFSNEMIFLTEDERKKTGLFLCDCSELSRLGEIEGDLKNLDTFIIDHHKTAETPENAKFIIDNTFPACALIIQLLYESSVGALTKEIATTLFFGTMTDTGFFRFLTTEHADVLVHISRLIQAGANPREMYDYITSGKSYNTRKLLGILLDHSKQYANGKLILTYETLEDTKKYGQDGRDSDLLYSILLAVKGVEAVVFIRQETENNCTAGFRSKDKIDVSEIAKKFGGGGHKNASGLSTNGKLETLIPAIAKEFSKVL